VPFCGICAINPLPCSEFLTLLLFITQIAKERVVLLLMVAETAKIQIFYTDKELLDYLTTFKDAI